MLEAAKLAGAAALDDVPACIKQKQELEGQATDVEAKRVETAGQHHRHAAVDAESMCREDP